MALFESLLALLLVSIVLLKLSGHIGAPYPTMLAFAGACVAALPWAPEIDMEPRLALALFIAPALLDAAYRPSASGAATRLAASYLARPHRRCADDRGSRVDRMGFRGDAACCSHRAWRDRRASRRRRRRGGVDAVPASRRTMAILQGESLLNDATALLIFTAAVAMAMHQEPSIASMVPQLVIAAPGGMLLGWVFAKLYFKMKAWLGQTLTARVSEFVATFGTWVIAEHLRVSPILAIVAFAMTAAHYGPAQQTARDRVHSYAIWELTVFILNVTAFLLMGLQARTILARLDDATRWQAIWFAVSVLVVVIVVRLAWVMLGSRIPRLFRRGGTSESTTVRESILIAWCGMRGLVTLATAFALPSGFPHRDVIVLSAFIVVLGSLIVQGLTVNLLIRWLRLEPDRSLDGEISRGRAALLAAALDTLRDRPGDAAAAVRAEYQAMSTIAQDRSNPQADTEHDRLRLDAIRAQRQLLARSRLEGTISDDAFHRLEEELDWAELHARPREDLELLDA